MIDDLFDVLYVAKTGKIKPDASLTDIALGLKLHERDFGSVEKTVDYAPIIAVHDAKAGPAVSVECETTPNTIYRTGKNLVNVAGTTITTQTNLISSRTFLPGTYTMSFYAKNNTSIVVNIRIVKL